MTTQQHVAYLIYRSDTHKTCFIYLMTLKKHNKYYLPLHTLSIMISLQFMVNPNFVDDRTYDTQYSVFHIRIVDFERYLQFLWALLLLLLLIVFVRYVYQCQVVANMFVD
mgnify:CR=1 FL=1